MTQARVHVGTQNAAKLEAVELGLAPFFSKLELKSREVASGVDEQPIGFDEIITGARNRARAALADRNDGLGVGIEDGLIPLSHVPTGYLNVGCCVIFDGDREGLGLSSGFEYPADCVEAAVTRVPIGDRFEEVFVAPPGWSVPTPGSGNIGRLTNGVLTRAAYGAQAVTCAYLRFLHPNLYGESVCR